MISAAQKRAVEKYNAAHYKQSKIRLSYEENEHFHRLAEEQGKSFNSFVVEALRAAISDESVDFIVFSQPSNQEDNTITLSLDEETMNALRTYGKRRNPPQTPQEFLLAYCEYQRELFEVMEENSKPLPNGQYGGQFRR